jgi:hypothetical protein
MPNTDLAGVQDGLRKIMRFKSRTAPGDCILVGMPAGLFFGLAHAIEPDIKKNWYRLRFTLLAIPPATLSWTLREPQMNGEIFTIDTKEHFVMAVDIDAAPHAPGDRPSRSAHGKPSHLKLAKK